VTYRCPLCAAPVSACEWDCRRCGRDTYREYKPAAHLDKLIRALRHPEPTTPIRAAWILGRIGTVEALPALISVAEHGPDLFIREAAIEALGHLGDLRAGPVLRALRRERSLLIRKAAIRALATLTAPHPLRGR
jgi:ParB family chromosome partitioning protein